MARYIKRNQILDQLSVDDLLTSSEQILMKRSEYFANLNTELQEQYKEYEDLLMSLGDDGKLYHAFLKHREILLDLMAQLENKKLDKDTTKKMLKLFTNNDELFKKYELFHKLNTQYEETTEQDTLAAEWANMLGDTDLVRIDITTKKIKDIK